LADYRYERGKEEGIGLVPNQWQQIFQVCNNNVLVEVTILGVFAKISMRIAAFSDMMLHHIREGFCPGL
jgi:hypothetical protein